MLPTKIFLLNFSCEHSFCEYLKFYRNIGLNLCQLLNICYDQYYASLSLVFHFYVSWQILQFTSRSCALNNIAKSLFKQKEHHKLIFHVDRFIKSMLINKSRFFYSLDAEFIFDLWTLIGFFKIIDLKSLLHYVYVSFERHKNKSQ